MVLEVDSASSGPPRSGGLARHSSLVALVMVAEHDRGRRVAAVSQERQHGFNADEGNDSLFRFMRHVVNVPSRGRILLERSTGASLEWALAIRPFLVFPVCSLLGQMTA